MDEWYKAAYYNPTSETYLDFPTGSNTAPTPFSSGTLANHAVFSQPFFQGPADITHAGGSSAYGIMGLGGNVSEWEETSTDLLNSSGSFARGLRGGYWFNGSISLSAANRNGFNPALGGVDIGFRVARLNSVPEPSCAAMIGISAMLGMSRRHRRR